MKSEMEKIEERMKKIPIMTLLGAEILSLKKGECSLGAPKKENYDGIFESFHGGLLATAADTAAAAATLTVAGADAFITTTDMSIRFLNPCNSAVKVVAKVIKPGKTLCPIGVDIFDEDGINSAVAQVTYMILGR